MKNLMIISFFLSANLFFAQEMSPKPDPSAKKSQESSAAQFPGGNQKFGQTLANKFNRRNVDCLISGTQLATIKFVVDTDGSMTDIKITGSNYTLNNEAMRIMKSVEEKWIPATNNGEKIRSTFTQPFRFMCD